MDVIIDSDVVSPDIVADWAVATTDVVHLLAVDSCTFMECEKAQYFTSMLITRQVTSVLASFVHHDKGQPADQNVLSTWNPARFWKRNLHGLDG